MAAQIQALLLDTAWEADFQKLQVPIPVADSCRLCASVLGAGHPSASANHLSAGAGYPVVSEGVSFTVLRK